MSVQRLQTDYRFAVLTLFGGLTILGVLPMAAYRFARGEIVAGVMDSLIVAGLAGAVAHLWRGGNIDHVAMAGAFIVNVGSVAACLLLGLPGMLWFYPVLLANSLLISPRHAFIASMLALTALAIFGRFDSVLVHVVFVITAMIVGLFAYIFAKRTASQHAQLQMLVTRDTLTSAYNRRAMEQELPMAIEASRRTRAPVGLAVMDLDHFKRINDSFGHEAGDRVLVEFARVVGETTRRGDRLFRYGGEEFVLLLPGMDSQALAALAETLRARVAGELSIGGNPVTVSIGVAEHAPGEAPNEWLARTDAAMYRAKEGGRNRVEVARLGMSEGVVKMRRERISPRKGSDPRGQ